MTFSIKKLKSIIFYPIDQKRDEETYVSMEIIIICLINDGTAV